MNYQDAKKLVKAHKARENYMLIQLESMTSCEKLVLPYKAGLAFIEALGQVEQWSHNYGTDHRLEGISPNFAKFSVMPAEEYDRLRMAILLGVTPQELKDAETAGRTDQLGNQINTP